MCVTLPYSPSRSRTLTRLWAGQHGVYEFYIFSETSKPALIPPPNLLVSGCRGPLTELKRLEFEADNPHLVLRLRRGAAIPLLPPHAFMAWMGTNLPFTFHNRVAGFASGDALEGATQAWAEYHNICHLINQYICSCYCNRSYIYIFIHSFIHSFISIQP